MNGPAPQSGSDLRIVFLGTPDAAARTLREVVAAGFHVPLAVTRPDRPKGRGRETAASPVSEAARAAGIAVFTPADVNAPESVERIRAEAPDLLLIVAYGSILKKAVRQVPRLLPMNVHFSLLPDYRGAAPVSRAIAEGKTRTGITLQRIVAKLDAGPVIAMEAVDIAEDETAGELSARLAEVGAALTVRTLHAIARGEWTETAQDDSRATLAPMLVKEDGEVDFTRDARAVHCHVRAMNPWPGAHTFFRSKSRGEPVAVTLLRSRLGSEEDSGLPPGTVTDAGHAGLAVQTGRGRVLVTELKPAGKRALTAQEFVNGYRAAPGDTLSR